MTPEPKNEPFQTTSSRGKQKLTIRHDAIDAILHDEINHEIVVYLRNGKEIRIAPTDGTPSQEYFDDYLDHFFNWRRNLKGGGS